MVTNAEMTDERVATKLKRVLRVHLAREAMTVTGQESNRVIFSERKFLSTGIQSRTRGDLREEGLSRFRSSKGEALPKRNCRFTKI